VSKENGSPSSSYSWQPFVTSANIFLQKTNEHVLQGLNPGGIYQAIWCRDAAYILKDWFLSGNIDGVMQHIYQIWSHQIEPNKEKVVYGRGSPEMKFSAEVAVIEKEKEFQGALPTTIYQAGFSEVYGLNPDIDSTALVISTTSWILARTIKQQYSDDTFFSSSSALSSSETSTVIASEHSADYVSALLSKVGITDPQKVVDFAVPRMLKAIEHLKSRDIDNDGLLEQSHNEDWMDTALRAGKIVYSQGCWLLALSDLSSLLSKLDRRKESDRLIHLAEKTIFGVEQKLWSEQDGCYIDIQESHNSDIYRILTQDISFYLIGISQNTVNDSLGVHHRRVNNKQIIEDQEKEQRQDEKEKLIHPSLHKRAISTLDAIRNRAWKEKWPLVTETELKRTGPWVLKPYQYHNHTFWPWTTGIEMLARSRFNKVDECEILLAKLASEGHPHLHAFYEWINPITDQASGAYPFRTGITAIRIAIADILEKINSESASHTFKQ
jgi:Glycosyl-hydrolase family 116, catalytic region